MRSKRLLAAAVIFCVAAGCVPPSPVVAVGGQGPQIKLPEPESQEYKPCGGDGGPLFVYGLLLKNAREPATSIPVTLSRHGSLDLTTTTDSQGRYCIRYQNRGEPLAALVFGGNGMGINVQYIAGNRSHVINKIFSANVQIASVTGAATPLGSDVTRASYGSDVDKAFFAVQPEIKNDSNEDRKVIAAGFDLAPGTAPSQEAPIKLPVVDPKLVARVAERGSRPRSLLSIGPVGIITIFNGEHRRDAVANVYEDALKINEVVPANSSITRVVFVSRAALPNGKDASKNPQDIMRSLGNFRVVWDRPRSAEVFKPASTSPPEPVAP